MSAFNPSTDLPATVNTVEKLVVWSTSLLNDLYLAQAAVESSSGSTRVVESAPYLITATQTPTWRLIGRTSFELEPTWRRGGRIWTYAREFGQLPIPSEYKT